MRVVRSATTLPFILTVTTTGGAEEEEGGDEKGGPPVDGVLGGAPSSGSCAATFFAIVAASSPKKAGAAAGCSAVCSSANDVAKLPASVSRSKMHKPSKIARILCTSQRARSRGSRPSSADSTRSRRVSMRAPGHTYT